MMRQRLAIIMGEICILAFSAACQTSADAGLLEELKSRGQGGLALIRVRSSLLMLLSFDGEIQSSQNPRDDSIASFSGDGETVVWINDTTPGDPLAACLFPVTVEAPERGKPWQLPGDVAYVRAMAVSSNGAEVAFDGTYKPEGASRNPSLWTVGLHYIDSSSNTMRLLLPLAAEQGPVTSISFSPDGAQFVYDHSNRIFIFDVKDGSTHQVAVGASPTWSPNGKWIAFRSSDGVATTLNASTLKVEALIDKRRIQTSVHWSPDSRFVMFSEPLGLISGIANWRYPFLPPTARMIVERIEDHAWASVYPLDPDGIIDDQGFYWVPDYRVFATAAASPPSIRPCGK
jgi:hypothetical protein